MAGSAEKVIDLLEAVARSAEPIGLMELAAAVGMDKSAASRHAAALVGQGLLRRNPDTRKYSVGDRTVAFACSVLGRTNLRSSAVPHLVRLRDASGETASLALRVGGERICVAAVESRHDVRRVVNVGERVLLHEGVCGEVLLSVLPAPDLRSALQDAEARGADMQRLHAGVLEARRRGYSAAEGLRVPGVSAIAVPVHADGVEQVAALVLAGPSQRFTAERMEAVAPAMTAAAAALSQSAPSW
jgi:DNA-binding IclR family transcriptional regulator